MRKTSGPERDSSHTRQLLTVLFLQTVNLAAVLHLTQESSHDSQSEQVNQLVSPCWRGRDLLCVGGLYQSADGEFVVFDENDGESFIPSAAPTATASAALNHPGVEPLVLAFFIITPYGIG
jgi:hypothetical protein